MNKLSFFSPENRIDLLFNKYLKNNFRDFGYAKNVYFNLKHVISKYSSNKKKHKFCTISLK